MGKRSRKRRGGGSAATVRKPSAPAATRRESRSEAKNAAVRAQLEPLEPGQRPTAVTVGAVVTLLAAAANLIAFLAGLEIRGERPAVSGIVGFSGLMFAMAWGLWRARYWAVLGLQVLLGLIVVVMSLFLLRAENLKSALLVLALIVPAGALFWFNVRAMARIQMPQRPERRR